MDADPPSYGVKIARRFTPNFKFIPGLREFALPDVAQIKVICAGTFV